MPKGRPQLAPGHHGGITVQNVGPSKYKARAYYRASNGQRYTMSRFGQTKAAARRALEAALQEWQRTALPPSPTTPVGRLIDEWLAGVAASDRATGTKQLYEHMARNMLWPHIAALAVHEVTTGYLDQVVQNVAAKNGPGAARTGRQILNGVFGHAVRRGLLLTNPVRETSPVSVRRKRPPRALTRDEAADLVEKLRADPRAKQLDLPDLVDFMLATGCRVGEALAVRDSVLDLEVGTVEVNATIVRVTGQGLVVQERPKTAAGWRVLALPRFVVDMVRRREGEVRFEAPGGVVFGSPFRASLRDPSNLSGDFRAAFDRAGYPWMTSHSLRKSVATWLDDAGWSARQIADQLGHAQPSLTLNTYMGRRVVSAEAAEVLDR